MFIDNELDTLDELDTKDLSTDFTLGDCLFGTAMLTKNSDKDNYGYSGCQMANSVKMLLFLVWAIVHRCMLIIEKRYLRFFGAGLTDGLDEF